MSFFDFAKKYLSECASASHTTPESQNKVVVYISDTSNEWNRAAVTLVEQRQLLSTSRKPMICFPTVEVKAHSDMPAFSTLDWNALAIANLSRSQKEKKL